MKNTLYLFFLLAISGLSSCEDWNLQQEDFIQVNLIQLTASDLTAAVAEAEVLDLSISQIEAHGFVWSSVAELPTININEGRKELGIKKLGDPPGFSSNFDQLLPNTRYFVRAYAQIKESIFYSEVNELQTGTGMVITEAIDYKNGRSLQISGRIIGSEAGIIGVNHGFCWSTTNTLPTLEDSFVDLGNQRTGSIFTYTLDSLTNNTVYHLRAYANLNINGALQTTYGEVLAFDGNLKDIWDLIASPPLEVTTFASKFAAFTIDNKAYLYAFNRVAQGQGNKGAESFLEYDPQSEQWTEKNLLPIEVIEVFGFNVGNRGFVYAYTAFDAINNGLPSTWQYDPSTDEWIRHIDHPATVKELAVSIGSGNRGYLGFGSFPVSPIPLGQPDWWEFNPDQNCDSSPSALPGCWTRKTDLKPQRYKAVGLALKDKIYTGMGRENLNPTTTPVIKEYRDWWEYDPEQESWTQKSNFIGEIATASTTFSLSGKAYVFGNNNTLWAYTPTTDSWETASPLPLDGIDSEINAVGFNLNEQGYLLTYSVGQTAMFWKFDQE